MSFDILSRFKRDVSPPAPMPQTQLEITPLPGRPYDFAVRKKDAGNEDGPQVIILATPRPFVFRSN